MYEAELDAAHHQRQQRRAMRQRGPEFRAEDVVQPPSHPEYEFDPSPAYPEPRRRGPEENTPRRPRPTRPRRHSTSPPPRRSHSPPQGREFARGFSYYGRNGPEFRRPAVAPVNRRPVGFVNDRTRQSNIIDSLQSNESPLIDFQSEPTREVGRLPTVLLPDQSPPSLQSKSSPVIKSDNADALDDSSIRSGLDVFDITATQTEKPRISLPPKEQTKPPATPPQNEGAQPENSGNFLRIPTRFSQVPPDPPLASDPLASPGTRAAPVQKVSPEETEPEETPEDASKDGDKPDAQAPISPSVSPPTTPPTKMWPRDQNTQDYVDNTPFCSLRLVCYRTGTSGCQIRHIKLIQEARFRKIKSREPFHKAKETENAISTDVEFFQALRDVYLGEMCGFWRRAFFLKTLRGIRVLSLTPNARPSIAPYDDFTLKEILAGIQDPTKFTSEHEWVDWVFRLRQPYQRHALEFVEGWNGTRIVVAGSIPLLLSTVVGVAWSVKGGNKQIQNAFAVAGFILTAISLLAALLAIISGVESSSRGGR